MAPQQQNNVTKAYRQQLQPWCLVQHLPGMKNQEIARFRRRNDADEHLRALCQLMPVAQYTIVFDPALETVQTDEQSLKERVIALQATAGLHIAPADSALI